MAPSRNFIGLVFQEILCVAGAMLLVFLTILFILLCLPIYTFRYSLKIYSKHFRPEFGKILSTASSVLATDNLYVKPTATIVVAIILEGKLERNVLTRTFVDRVLNAKNSRGEQCYPELQQYMERLLGFSFWRQGDNFDVRNHIRVHNNNNEFHEKDLPELMNTHVGKPFRRGQSPWSLTLVHNYKLKNDMKNNDRTALLVRYHHALADGFSMLKLLNKLFDNPVLEPTKDPKKSTSWYGALKSLANSFIVPYRVLKVGVEAFDVNDWHLKIPTTQVSSAMYPKISVPYLKQVQEFYQVSSLTSVIFAGLAGALRRAMLERGVAVPDSVNCLLPIAVPGHPDDKLRNYAAVAVLELPVGIPDPGTRLKMIDRNLASIKADPMPAMLLQLVWIMGGLFSWMIRPFIFNIWTTIVASSFQGPKKQFSICGLQCSDLTFVSGFLMNNNSGIGMSTVTYNGNMRICLAMEKALLFKMPNPSVEDILNGIGLELDVLHKNQIV